MYTNPLGLGELCLKAHVIQGSCMCICQPPALTLCDIKTCCAKCTFMELLAMLESAVLL